MYKCCCTVFCNVYVLYHILKCANVVLCFLMYTCCTILFSAFELFSQPKEGKRCRLYALKIVQSNLVEISDSKC